MNYQEFQNVTDRILKMAMRKKDLSLALKCADLKYKYTLEHEARAPTKPLNIEDLTMDDIDHMIKNIEDNYDMSSIKGHKKNLSSPEINNIIKSLREDITREETQHIQKRKSKRKRLRSP